MRESNEKPEKIGNVTLFYKVRDPRPTFSAPPQRSKVDKDMEGTPKCTRNRIIERKARVKTRKNSNALCVMCPFPMYSLGWFGIAERPKG